MPISLPEVLNSDVAKNLTDKLASATGWAVTHKTPKKIATDTLIDEFQKLNINPVEKAALISSAPKIIKEYSNQHDIVALALEKLSDQSKPNEVDDDWLSSFMDQARLVNSDELKLIWGHVLAEECNSPGKFPKALLRILSDTDSTLATAFSTLCNCTIQICDPDNHPHPIIFMDPNRPYISSAGLSFDILSDLDSLGLIRFASNSALGFNYTFRNSNPLILYSNHWYSFLETPPAVIQTGQVVFTRSGEALFSVVTPTEIPNFIESFVVPMTKMKLQMQ